jgi:hypothetical protein
MAARRHRVIVTAPLHNVGDRSAIDLNVEDYVPSKNGAPQNDKTPTTRLSGGSSDGDCANKNENEKQFYGGGKCWLHGLTLFCGILFSQPRLHQVLDLSRPLSRCRKTQRCLLLPLRYLPKPRCDWTPLLRS